MHNNQLPSTKSALRVHIPRITYNENKVSQTVEIIIKIKVKIILAVFINTETIIFHDIFLIVVLDLI